MELRSLEVVGKDLKYPRPGKGRFEDWTHVDANKIWGPKGQKRLTAR